MSSFKFHNPLFIALCLLLGLLLVTSAHAGPERVSASPCKKILDDYTEGQKQCIKNSANYNECMKCKDTLKAGECHGFDSTRRTECACFDKEGFPLFDPNDGTGADEFWKTHCVPNGWGPIYANTPAPRNY